MKIAVAADHAGFELKNNLRDRLRQLGHQVEDHGTDNTDSADYPDFAHAVAVQVANGLADRGILVCSTGIGMAIMANKVAGVRAVVAANEETARFSRSHNDANVLTIGSRFVTADEAVHVTEIFLGTEFDGGARHVRRLAKISMFERATHEEQIAQR